MRKKALRAYSGELRSISSIGVLYTNFAKHKQTRTLINKQKKISTNFQSLKMQKKSVLPIDPNAKKTIMIVQSVDRFFSDVNSVAKLYMSEYDVSAPEPQRNRPIHVSCGVGRVRVRMTPIMERERDRRTMFLRPTIALKMILKTRPIDAPRRIDYCIALLSDIRSQCKSPKALPIVCILTSVRQALRNQTGSEQTYLVQSSLERSGQTYGS